MKIFQQPESGVLDYLQWLRNLCKCYRTKKVFYSAICSFTEVVTFRSCLRKHAVVVFEVEWERSLAWLYDTDLKCRQQS